MEAEESKSVALLPLLTIAVTAKVIGSLRKARALTVFQRLGPELLDCLEGRIEARRSLSGCRHRPARDD